MYQNQGRAREPCSEVLSSDCFKMPKIVSKCPRAIRLFQNAQNCFKMPNSGSRVIRDCFKMPKIVSKCPMSDHVIWHVSIPCLLECFKMPKIVSKCPIADHALPEIVSKCPKLFQNAQNLSYGYWIIITTQLLSALRALLTIWIVLLNVLPHQSWFVIRDVNLTYHNYSWQQLEWSHVVLTPRDQMGRGDLITIPYFGSRC